MRCIVRYASKFSAYARHDWKEAKASSYLIFPISVSPASFLSFRLCLVTDMRGIFLITFPEGVR